MLRLMGAAALVALAAASPLYAQDGDDDDDSRGQVERDRDDDDGDDDDRRGNGRGDRVDARAFRDIRDVREGDFRRAVAERADLRRFERGRDDDDDDVRRGDWDGDGDWDGRGRIFASVPGCPPGLARRNGGCLPPGFVRRDRDDFGYEYRPSLFGIPLRTSADYSYFDGYLVPAANSGLSYIPLLGGALAVGNLWPDAYPSLQLADWQNDYYGFENPDAYRYADNVVYQVDPETSAIESVVALLTGNDFNVGERMPLGYDIYNVPGQYQDKYQDSGDALYRYADGQVLQIDPATMLIEKVIELIA